MPDIEQVSTAVMNWASIREVCGSNLSHVTGHPKRRIFVSFPWNQ